MIKKFLQNLKDNFKDYIKNHLVTNILLLLISIVIIIVDLDNAKDFIPRLLTTLFLTAMFTTLAESYTKDNKKRSIIYIIGLIISIFLSKCILESELARYLIGTVLILGFTILYLIAKNSKETTNKFLTSTYTNLLKFGIIGSILNTGLLLILALISSLLIEVGEAVFVKLEIVLFVLYYIPALIISLETKEEENKFIYILVNYVSLPQIALATLVIYLYLIKLLVTLKLPYTQTFATNAILLSLGIPIVLMSLSYDKNKLPYKIANILKKLFIPLVLLQIFSLSLRIYDYSITTSRYFGIILLILGIISMILLNKNNGNNYKLILLPCVILSITSFIIPYINIYELPNYMQINRLKQILPEGKHYKDLTKKEKETVTSIFYTVYEDKYYPAYLPKKELEKQIYSNNKYDYRDYIDDEIYYTNKTKKIDISKYNQIEEYSSYNYKELSITVNNNKYDLTQYCKELYKYHQKNNNLDNYMKEKNIIELDNNIDLYIKDITLEYNDKHLSIEGYIQYK